MARPDSVKVIGAEPVYRRGWRVQLEGGTVLDVGFTGPFAAIAEKAWMNGRDIHEGLNG